ADGQDEGHGDTGRVPDDGLQADGVGLAEVAGVERLASLGGGHRRGRVRERDQAKGRRLKPSSTTIDNTPAVPWRSRTTSAPNCSTTATTTPNPTSGSAVPPSSRLRTDSPRMPWPTPACSATATPTPSMLGSTITRTKGCPACAPTDTAAAAGGVFSRARQRRQQLPERLQQGPAAEAPGQAAAAEDPPPSRWTLETIRATFDWLSNYTLSGVWRQLQRWDLHLRSARVQQFSPDPQYADKVLDLEMALWEARRYPDT